MIRTLLLVLVCGVATASVRQESGNQLVPVTIKYSGFKKTKSAHNYRMQIMPRGDSLEILSFGMSRLPRTIRALKFRTGARTGRNDIEHSVARSLDSTYRFVTARQLELSFRIPRKNDYERGKLLFLSGRKSSPYFPNQWTSLGTVHAGAGTAFTTRGRFRKHNFLDLDLIPGAMAWEFPAIDPYHCEPATVRFFKLRKLEGYGLARIRYIPYEGRARQIIRRTFDVYFAHNQAVADRAGLGAVERYLNENNYVILKAELEGGCSIEGSAARNRTLQQQRASVLRASLHRYSDELLRKDTVIFTDAISQFRSMIAKSEFAYLDTLSDEALTGLVNGDAALRTRLEPFLASQRKAVLKLVMAKRLSYAEQLNGLVAAMNKELRVIMMARTAHSESESKIMGMLQRLFDDLEQERISLPDLRTVITDGTVYPDYIRIMTGYHLIKKFASGDLPPSTTWRQYWDRYHVHEWLDEARAAAIALASTAREKEMRSRFVRMLVDFQAYTYEFIEARLIDVSELCQIPYPQRQEFMGLILNQYAYLYEAASVVENEDTASAPDGIHCIPRRPISKVMPETTPDVDSLVQQAATKKSAVAFELINNRLIRLKHFNDQPKSPYYFLLKEYYLKNNAQALALVRHESDESPVQLNVFNLWHLASLTVGEWDPFENYFYDEEVQLEQMERIISALKKADAILCRPQINSLYLEYHLKTLNYLQHYAEPGNPVHARLGEAAFRFVTNYYKSRAKAVTPRLSLHVVQQLNLFNWLPGGAAGAWYAYDLLNAIARSRTLSEAEHRLYSHYVKIYNPRLKKLPPLIDPVLITAQWEESF